MSDEEKVVIKSREGSTASSLSTWERKREKLGRIQEASCHEGGHLRITGELADMDLSGCTCGYSGQGPQGTAKVLQDLGIEAEKAWQMAQMKQFLILCGVCEAK